MRLRTAAAGCVLAATLLSASTADTASAHPTCSARGLAARLPAQQLPPAVASIRARIARAAVRCDYAGLTRLGNEVRKGVTFSFGGSGSAGAYWRAAETEGGRPLERLVRLLRLPFARNEAGHYVWPSAHRARPTERDWRLLVGIYGAAEIAAMKRAGSGYGGHRIGITPRGDWMFFVAGD